MSTEANIDIPAPKVALHPVVRLWRRIWPRKEWMVVWGRGFARFKPRKERVWFWFGDPCEIMIDGCGPFTSDEIDDVLAKFYEPNTGDVKQ